MDEIKEIRIKEVEELSEEGKKEVRGKLNEINKQGTPFDFRGYAKVFYAETSPLRAVKIEPIEGDIRDELHRLSELMNK